MRVNLKSCIAPAFYKVHNHIKNNDYSKFWFKGGRNSTKSSFVAIQVVLGILRDPNANAIVFRKTAETIRTSVFSNVLWAIDMLGCEDFFKHTMSPPQITYLPTGQKIIFKGLDKPAKVKSIKLERGYFKILWFEELEEFGGIKEIRNVEQSTRRGGEKFTAFYTFNPPNDPAAWVNKESEEDYSDRLVHFSNYLQVPVAWLGNQVLIDAEDLKRRDPLAYEHEYMGIACGRAEQIVFHGKWKEKEFLTPDRSEIYQNRFFYGADWGFAGDPTALVRSFIKVENGERNLYIEYEAGGREIDIDKLPPVFDSIPESRKWKIYADCSRPETISYVRKSGFNCQAAPKWTGSVEDGVAYLRSFNNIFVHPRCIRTKEEFIKYSYKVDKHTQEILPIIVDKWNHFMDAIRYSLADYIKAKVSIMDVL